MEFPLWIDINASREKKREEQEKARDNELEQNGGLVWGSADNINKLSDYPQALQMWKFEGVEGVVWEL